MLAEGWYDHGITSNAVAATSQLGILLAVPLIIILVVLLVRFAVLALPHRRPVEGVFSIKDRIATLIVVEAVAVGGGKLDEQLLDCRLAFFDEVADCASSVGGLVTMRAARYVLALFHQPDEHEAQALRFVDALPGSSKKAAGVELHLAISTGMVCVDSCMVVYGPCLDNVMRLVFVRAHEACVIVAPSTVRGISDPHHRSRLVPFECIEHDDECCALLYEFLTIPFEGSRDALLCRSAELVRFSAGNGDAAARVLPLLPADDFVLECSSASRGTEGCTYRFTGWSVCGAPFPDAAAAAVKSVTLDYAGLPPKWSDGFGKQWLRSERPPRIYRLSGGCGTIAFHTGISDSGWPVTILAAGQRPDTECLEHHVRVAALLGHHRNIVRVHSVARFNDRFLIAVEDLPLGGGAADLSWLLREFIPISVSVIRQLARQLLDAIVHLQNRRIAHCSMTLESIRLFADGTLRLGLFFAAALEYRIHPTLRAVRQSPFEAPEVVEGRRSEEEAMNTANLHPQCDMFSFGAILLALVCGHRALPSSLVDAPVATLIGSAPIPEVLKAAAADLVSRCLAVDPASRPTPVAAQQHCFFVV